jgi:hypothetical protein
LKIKRKRKRGGNVIKEKLIVLTLIFIMIFMAVSTAMGMMGIKVETVLDLLYEKVRCCAARIYVKYFLRTKEMGDKPKDTY